MWPPGLLEVMAPLSMGRNAHVIFREFQKVFGSRHLTVSHKESIVSLLSLLSCVQVITIHSAVVKALAGVACSPQALTMSTETAGQSPRPLVLAFYLDTSGPRSHKVARLWCGGGSHACPPEPQGEGAL